MKPSEAFSANRPAIRKVVESHRARNARVFGSVLRGQDRREAIWTSWSPPCPAPRCSTSAPSSSN
jgi:hypothetical protein